MPGIDTAAPERTDTSNGRRAAPNARPVAVSRRAIPSASVLRNAMSLAGCGCRHQLVGSTKAAGTGRPACAMRMRFHALLPTSGAPPFASVAPGRMA